MGWLYQNGWGVPRDYAKAREWYERAAAAGNVAAMANLGWLYRDGLGVPRDYEKARDWYEKAAAAGYSIGMINVGWFYQNGWGVPRDVRQGARMVREGRSSRQHVRHDRARLDLSQRPRA